MYADEYLIDVDVDFTSLKHKIAEKTLVSYMDYSQETKNTYDKMNTIYQLLKFKLHEIDDVVVNKYLKTLDYNLSKYAAITKIMKNVNHLFSEVLDIVALSNKSLMLNQIFRQMIEYFTVFNIILKHPDAISVLYLNHLHVLEYEVVKSKDEYVDDNLKRTYNACIFLFASYHDIDIEIAKKEYSKPYGWAYKLIVDENGDYYNYINSKKVREFVFNDYFDENFLDTFNRYIKTADMAVHPTSTYIYDLSFMDEKDSDYREFIFQTSLGFYIIMLEFFKTNLRKESVIDRLVEYSISSLGELKFKMVSEEIKPNSDYKIINKYNRYSIKHEDPKEKAQLILYNFDENNVSEISYLETLHFQFYQLDTLQKSLYKELDQLYAIVDVYFYNLYYFYPTIVKKSVKLENIRHLYWIISFLYHELAVSYAFQQIPLMQKVYRLFIEYTALLDRLISSTERINESFKLLSYVLLENSIYTEGFDSRKSDELLIQIKTKLNLQDQVNVNKLKDFMGWTSQNNKSNKITHDSITDLVKEFISKFDKRSDVFYVIWKECNPIIHAGSYANEMNNDFIDNKYAGVDYVGILYLCTIHTLLNFIKFTEGYNDEKLTDSMKLVTGSVIALSNKYSKKIEKLKKKIQRH